MKLVELAGQSVARSQLSLIVSYLTQTDTLNIGQEAAGQHVAIYWGGAMVGRFVGAGILRVINPGKVLASVATAAILLILISANTVGAISGWALLAIGLMNSIMFPTIFTLASAGLGKRAAEGCLGARPGRWRSPEPHRRRLARDA